ncbi:POT family proton-dependent oligopeptide transporter [Povalibacter uvarum]|uniref:POT family proton-dependent oligopeptide transporter n=1 Tax=Povalibacter uvarum TaxID=732238 RepID=A0A841HNB0_9GAMM|nr:peptide MFS transporter [Povalibacter uvarum]MBB6093760.1 POT family proton-dependent oligopeptide transporter [Povalibacter uvarum]
MSTIVHEGASALKIASAPRAEWFGHPRGLTILFLTEMWEKFSYFGMRALLVYYMTKSLAMPQSQASWVYGIYTAFAYFTPIVGGLIADRFLGRRSAVILGGSIMALGHFMMAFESLFYPALATIALGNGLFLPSLPSQVLTLYDANDPRRTTAYNIYYVGINLGAVLAPFVCGTLGELYGWHWGFGAAGIGMCLGLLIYIGGSQYLPESVRQVQTREAASQAERDTFMKRLGLLIGVVAMVVVFRGAYEQIGNTVALWADSSVDRSVGPGWTIPGSWFQALNPLLVFMLTPVLLAIWRKRGRPTAPVRRMAIGAFIVAAAYVLLALVSQAAGGLQAHWVWLVLFLIVYTTGELFILPTGLALFGQLAPATLAATSIALWFSASFGGNLLAGALGSWWSRMDHATFFLSMAGVAALAASLLLLVDRPARNVLRTDAT